MRNIIVQASKQWALYCSSRGLDVCQLLFYFFATLLLFIFFSLNILFISVLHSSSQPLPLTCRQPSIPSLLAIMSHPIPNQDSPPEGEMAFAYSALARFPLSATSVGGIGPRFRSTSPASAPPAKRAKAPRPPKLIPNKCLPEPDFTLVSADNKSFKVSSSRLKKVS
jgi:hypothetical protein